jgi:pyruvate/2-oxoglutarate dehydrogenase complex dihydrolipoamide acyltransferase (E2) component
VSATGLKPQSARGYTKIRGGIDIVTTLKVPKTGGIPTTKASVLRWLKHEGEPVQAGEAVVELETEKVSYELESPIAGTLLKILAEESTQVPVGGQLCHIGQQGESVSADSGSAKE